jgi:predicted membrane channel-forming protein YqfA (hemolysin III family)
MTIVLVVLIVIIAYVGVPILVATPYQRNGQTSAGNGWIVACLVLPVVTLFVSSAIFEKIPYANGGPGTVWDNFLYSGITAAAAWVLLTLAAFLCAPILRDERG